MNRQEQIIKMRPVLDGVCCEDCMIDNIADSLIDAGYGNINQALTEFVDKLKVRFNNITDEYGFHLVSYNSEDIYSKIEKTLKEFTSNGDIS